MNNVAQDFADVTQDERFVMVTMGKTEHRIVVGEVTMGNLRDFTRACEPFLAEFDEAGMLAEKRNPDTGELEGQEEFALFKVLSEHNLAFCRAAALVTNADQTFYERLRPDEFFKVAALVVEVNGNFFVQKLAPQLIRFARAMGMVGLSLSSFSSAQAIGTPTFSTTP